MLYNQHLVLEHKSVTYLESYHVAKDGFPLCLTKRVLQKPCMHDVKGAVGRVPKA
jgi:hypothetical protein